MRTVLVLLMCVFGLTAAGCQTDTVPTPDTQSHKLGFSGIALRASGATTPITVSGTRPSAANQFADITGWKLGGRSPRFAVMDFDGSTAATVASPTGGSTGPELWGIVNGNIRLLGSTRASPIVITGDLQGYDEETQDVGVATALFVAGTPSAGTVTVSFIPTDSDYSSL